MSRSEESFRRTKRSLPRVASHGRNGQRKNANYHIVRGLRHNKSRSREKHASGRVPAPSPVRSELQPTSSENGRAAQYGMAATMVVTIGL